MLAIALAGPAMFVVPVSMIALEIPAISMDFPCTVSAKLLNTSAGCNVYLEFYLLFMLISQYCGVPTRLWYSIDPV
jgi:hypothetical protein